MDRESASTLPHSIENGSRVGRVLSCVAGSRAGEGGVELREGFGHVPAAEAETDVVGLVVDGTGEEKDAGLLDYGFAERLDVERWLRWCRGFCGCVTHEADGAGVGGSPGKLMGAARDEIGEKFQIVYDELAIALGNFLAMAKGEVGEEFAGGAAADCCVVLEFGAELENFGVARNQPAEAETGWNGKWSGKSC